MFPGVDENFFFVIPTNKVTKGDIILVNGKPKCVIEADKTKITVINYEDSTVETILPERHVFMGNTYFMGKLYLCSEVILEKIRIVQQNL